MAYQLVERRAVARSVQPELGEASRTCADLLQRGATWAQLVELLALNRPSVTALSEHSGVQGSAPQQLSYAALWEAVVRTAGGLSSVQARLPPGSPPLVVGACLPRGIDYTVTLLACSYLGAQFVPMPVDYPAQRLAAVATGACVTLFVHFPDNDGIALKQVMIDQRAVRACVSVRDTRAYNGEGPPLNPDNQAGGVVLSSSGSTGTPKLIARSQRSFSHRLLYTWRTHGYQPVDVCIQKSPQTTTHSLYELLEPLLSGQGVHVLPEVGKVGLPRFVQMLRQLRVTRLLMVPSLLEAIVAHWNMLELPPSLRLMTLMGEAPKPHDCVALAQLRPDLQILTIYGCTESSSCMVLDVSRFMRERVVIGGIGEASASPVAFPLGVPIAPEVELQVLGPDGVPVPLGERGVLFLKGPFLFEQYVGQPDLTAQVLTPQGYNTKDEVRFDGSEWAYLGRVDDVVKVHGHRVQLSEIEHHARAFSNVEAAAAMVAEAGGLALFVVPDSVDIASLKQSLGRDLPHYMMPRFVTAIKAMPLLANGKRDRLTLAQMLNAQVPMGENGDTRNSTTNALANHSAFEMDLGVDGAFDSPLLGLGAGSAEGFIPQVLAIVRSVTGTNNIDPADHLSDAGIDSINMMLLLPQLKALGGQDDGEESISSMFLVSNPTITEICNKLAAHGEDGANNKRMNMEACFGLRTIFCLWIVRGHMVGICESTDVSHNDQNHFWRTVVFMLLSGMTMSMQFDKAAPMWKRLVWQAAPPLFPAYWFAYWVQFPVSVPPCWPFLGGAAIVICSLMNLLLMQAWGPGFVLPSMGHAWYLTVQLLFYCVFNTMMRAIKRRQMKTLHQFARRVLAVFGVLLVFRVLFLWMPFVIHFFPLFRLPDFKIGMLVGQAVLHVDMDAVTEKKVGIATDMAIFAVFLLAFQPQKELNDVWVGFMWFLGDWLLAFILFGLCRTRCYAARILSHPFIAEFGQYSYCVYLIHYPVLQWSRNVAVYALDSWKKVFEADYSAMQCDAHYDDKSSDFEDCELPPWMYIGNFTVIIVAAVVMTKLIHQPFQRFWNNRLGKVTEWVRFDEFDTSDAALSREIRDCCCCCGDGDCECGEKTAGLQEMTNKPTCGDNCWKACLINCGCL